MESVLYRVVFGIKRGVWYRGVSFKEGYGLVGFYCTLYAVFNVARGCDFGQWLHITNGLSVKAGTFGH